MKKLFQIFPAFTLIELLVVISIIGILAALLLANFAGIRDRADDARLKNNIKQYQTALRMYYNDNQSYPPNLTGADAGNCPNLQTAGYIDEQPTGCKYNQLTTDTFVACVSLSNSADTDSGTSVTRCGRTGSLTNPYCVCGK